MVSGASRGIGFAVAKAFADPGATVLAASAARRDRAIRPLRRLVNSAGITTD